MKLPIPLYGRMIGWLALNLLLLAMIAAALGFAGAPWASEAVWQGAARSRIETLAAAVGGELATQPSGAWSPTLARFSKAYGGQFALYASDGRQLAGPPMELPARVRAEVRLRPPRSQRPPPGARRGSPVPPEPDFFPPPGQGPEGPPRHSFFLRDGAPPRYFAGVRLPELFGEGGGNNGPPALILTADTLWGAALVDPAPWAAAAAAAVAVSALFWAPFAWSLTGAIRAMATTTERLADGQFGAAAPVRRGDELGALADSINRLGSRLENFVTGQRRFLGDVAHELISPIARLELSLELAGRNATEAQLRSLEDARDELQQMGALVEELLAFSKAGLRPAMAPLEMVALRPILLDAAERDGGGLELCTVEADAGLEAAGHRELLRRAVGNLVRNARRHGGGERIVLSARADGDSVLIAVADSGPGVPEEALARLGEPFYRPDASRTRDTGGVGLGLAIVKTCAEACRGSLRLSNRSPRGFEAQIRLRRRLEPLKEAR